jgi:hypothetical protein
MLWQAGRLPYNEVKDGGFVGGGIGGHRPPLQGIGALAGEEGFGSAFHAREDVVDRLRALADEFGADDAGDEVGGDGEDFFRGAAFETAAEDGGHGLGEGLDFGTERDFELGMVLGVDVEEDADGVGAFFVFADVFEGEGFAFGGFPVGGAFGVVDEVLPFFGIGEVFEEIDNLLEGGGERGGSGHCCGVFSNQCSVFRLWESGYWFLNTGHSKRGG